MTEGTGTATRTGHGDWSEGVPVLVLGAIGFWLSEGVTVLGRQGKADRDPADVDLSPYDPDRLVSRRHVELRFAGGLLTVRDLGSTNGTRVEGVTLEPERDHPLRPGDVLVVGDVGMTVVSVQPAVDEEVPDLPPADREAAMADQPTASRPAVRTRPAPASRAGVPAAAATGPSRREPAPREPPPRPIAPPAQSAFPANATMIPRHHYRDEEDEDDTSAESRWRLGSLADRLRRRRDP